MTAPSVSVAGLTGRGAISAMATAGALLPLVGYLDRRAVAAQDPAVDPIRARRSDELRRMLLARG